MRDAGRKTDQSPPDASQDRRRVRWERLGIGAAIGLVFMTAVGSAWLMLLGAAVGLGAMLAWELVACRRAGGA